MNKVLIFTFCFLLYYIAYGQDAHFSQYYQIPGYLNPAMVGNFNGLYKVGTNYRDQWRPALQKPLATFTAIGESRFQLGDKRNPDQAALGIMFFSDKMSQFDLTTTQIALTGSYHKLLDDRNNQYLGIGYQAAITQKALNYENLTFGDQFNAIDAYSNKTLELLPVNNFGLFDMSLGVHYSINPKSGRNFNIGLAAFHITKPNISFFAKENEPNTKLDLKGLLDTRLVAHVSYNIPTNPSWDVEPRALYMFQDQHKMFVLSTLFKYDNLKTENKVFYFGPAIRISNSINNLGLESFILTGGFDINGLNIGLSYDHNIKDLIGNRNGLGTFEISLNYVGEYENTENFCPKF